MRIPGLACENCGGSDIRKAHTVSLRDSLRGLLGVYPFRCGDCHSRFFVSVWLFSRLPFAKCPRCLKAELATWSRRYYRMGLWEDFLITMGAQKYRCSACRCNFVSFRPRKIAKKARQAQNSENLQSHDRKGVVNCAGK